MVTTIHQPNGSITRCFDDLLLLARGALVYSGPWAGAVGYFDSHGFKCAPNQRFPKVSACSPCMHAS